MRSSQFAFGSSQPRSESWKPQTVRRPSRCDSGTWVPWIQNGHHFAYSLQVVFENRFEIVAARGSLLQKDTELVVDEEANVEIARPHQTLSKHLQRALHLQQSILLSEWVKAGCFDVHVCALETLRFDQKTNGEMEEMSTTNHPGCKLAAG